MLVPVIFENTVHVIFYTITQKGITKTNLDFLEQETVEWQWE